ncbi:Pentatricopeptide repeat-containing protein [Vitis vinifera]|uniref:Pentatricopeptide repeat-containing protein n=1 Tax=Vitis vinifera TaxID=29760 RepID=A0A438DQJ5_VITVI|nr:Pentatricopeptide repeat-containing protein [Vitis vinifera]
MIRTQKNPLTALKIFNEAKSKFPNYRHNGPVYATMINVLGSSGRIAEMREVIDQMKQDSCECKDSFNCVNWTGSFNTLLRILVKESKLETACRLFLEHSCGWEVKSRIGSLNLLMDALCQINRSDLALHVFQEMRLNEATHLLYSMFWRISQKGGGEDIAAYRTLLDALCDNGHVEEALEILGKVLKKGLKAPKRCRGHLDLSYCCNGEDIERTKGLINEALIRGGVPSMASYSAMAIDLYSERKIGEANQVLDEMRDRGFKPSLSIYEAKIAALCRCGGVEEAVKVIKEEMVEDSCVPTVRLYNIVLKGLCREGKSAFAVGYLEKMARQVGCVADKETYSILVDGLCCDGRFVEASGILERMLIRSSSPGVETYNTLIRGLCLMGRQYDAVIWLEEMVVQGKLPAVSVWDSLVASVCSNMTEAGVCSETLEKLWSS